MKRQPRRRTLGSESEVARILICEDDDLYRQIAEAAFAGSNHQLFFAHNGDQALVRLKSDGVDLVITDLVMPGKDGLEVIRDIRATHNRIPILAMTAGLASLKEPLLVAATALGADDVIEKPFRPVALRQRTEALLNKVATKRDESAA
ncbi:MAG: response regulator [Alphaproteobacteria bacterium]|nr:response regulator [Alphaproteobacteria bacterium]